MTKKTELPEQQGLDAPLVSSSCKKTIVWSNSLFDNKTLKSADIRITGIYINNVDDIVTVNREIGTDVKRITMSMELAKEIGFINLDALSNYC